MLPRVRAAATFVCALDLIVIRYPFHCVPGWVNPSRIPTSEICIVTGVRSHPKQILGLLVVTLLFVGLLRLWTFILHEPLLAYANNYDMIRIQSCHQIWPADGILPPGAQSYGAPLEEYQRFRAPGIGQCFPSSELVFTTPVANWYSLADDPENSSDISIRQFGIFRGLLVSGLFLWAIAVFWIRQGVSSSIALSLFWATLATDPANLLYFNTFYTEFSALFFSWTLVITLAYLLHQSDRPLPYIFSSVAALGLALSKFQHLLLPVALTGGFLIAVIIRHRAIRLAIPRWILFPILAAFAGLSIQAYWGAVSAPETVNQANTTNLVLDSALPVAEEKAWLVEVFGLPPHCVKASGISWYTPGVPANHPCPEVFNISRWKLLQAMASRPSFGIDFIAGAVARTSKWITPIVGQVAGKNLATVSSYKWTVNEIFLLLPDWFFYGVFILSCGLSLFGFYWLFTSHGGDRAILYGLIWLSGIGALEVVAVALIGEGYMDFVKHTHLYWNLVGMQLIGALTVGVRATIGRSGPAEHGHDIQMAELPTCR